MPVQYSSSGGGGGGAFTPGNTRYVDAVNGLDSNTGGPTDPFQTISAAMSSIGSATSNADFNTDATARWLIEVGPGVYTENVSVPTRQFIDIHLNNALISGNVTQTFDASVIGSGPIIQNKLVIRGDDVRAEYTGSQMPYSGISGNVVLAQNNSPTSFMQLYLLETGVGGNIEANLGSVNPANFDCSVECIGAMVAGDIQANSGNAITLYAHDCNDSGTRSLGGVTGQVSLYRLSDVIFSGIVIPTGSNGYWTNVVFLSGANDLTGYGGTVNADLSSYNSFYVNVPSKGTFTFHLTDAIPQLSTDPVTPPLESAWVLYNGTTYQLSYRTLQGTTVRTLLS